MTKREDEERGYKSIKKVILGASLFCEDSHKMIYLIWFNPLTLREYAVLSLII